MLVIQLVTPHTHDADDDDDDDDDNIDLLPRGRHAGQHPRHLGRVGEGAQHLADDPVCADSAAEDLDGHVGRVARDEESPCRSGAGL
jgi:hypothetical protein